MRAFLKLFVYYSIKFIIFLRYRIHVKDLDKVRANALNKGTLFLPNHPAEIDPIILSYVLWKPYAVRPVVVEWVYKISVIHGIIKLMRGIPIPDFEQGASLSKRRRGDSSFQEVVDGLNHGENILVYPAGRLKTSNLEHIGGASGTNKIIHAVKDDINIVLVRSTGLWGSSFSKALNDEVKLVKVMLHALKCIFLNGIFFLPRRHVYLEFELAKSSFPRKGPRGKINEYLESWLNRPVQCGSYKSDKGEPLVLVPYYFWGKKNKFLTGKTSDQRDFSIDKIPDSVRQHIIEEIARMTKKLPSAIHLNMNLFIDLKFDSLDIQDLLTFLEDHYEVRGAKPKDLTTVKIVMGYAVHIFENQQKEEIGKKASIAWGKDNEDQSPLFLGGETLLHILLQISEKRGKDLICYDPIIGEMSYKRLRQSVIILAKKLQKFPGERIGVLFPASITANIIILASMMARKVPVMINWTVGPRHLKAVLKSTGIKNVITSKRILQGLSDVDLTPLESLFITVEDLKKEVSIVNKLYGLYLSNKSSKEIIKAFCIQDLEKSSIAVLLFTSGTESMPKGVPLSHDNILSNFRSALKRSKLNKSDSILGFLPPFHSFGFTVAGLLPLIAGLRVSYYPNPTQYRQLANMIRERKITVLPGAPSFLKGIMHAGKKTDFASIRYIISGAEKATQSLYDAINSLGSGKELLEGYGITECSPILTLNIPGKPSKGVGPPLDGVDICIVDIVTNKLVHLEKEGHILAKGKNVFGGYFGKLPSPFIYFNGDLWYKTGDIGFLDEDGNLTLTSRLKRLVKVGGEIVSLTALEEECNLYFLRKKVFSEDDEPKLAIGAIEKEGSRPLVCLFSTFEITLEEISKIVKKAGFSNLYRVNKIIRIKKIPMMASGKVNYRKLEEKL